MEKQLYLSDNKKILGVCGGIAERYNIDPTVVRFFAIFIAFTVYIVPVGIMYLVLGLGIIKAKPIGYPEPQNKETKRIIRDEKKLLGVCEALGKYFEVDPTIFRALFIVLGVFYNISIVIIYIAGVVLIPEVPKFNNMNQQYYGQNPNSQQGFNGQNPNSQQGFDGQNPNSQQGFNGQNPNSQQGFNGQNPYNPQGFNGQNPNSQQGFNGQNAPHNPQGYNGQNNQQG